MYCTVKWTLESLVHMQMYCTVRIGCLHMQLCYAVLFRVCGARQNFYVFSLYINPDLNYGIFDCLLTSMAVVQTEVVWGYFLFIFVWVIWMAIIRSGWVLWPRTVMVLQPLTSQLCLIDRVNQTVTTHALGDTLDLLLTDVPDLVPVAAVAPIGNSDNSSLSAVISNAQAVPNLCFVGQFSWNIKSIGIQFVVQYRISPGVSFGVRTILLMFRTNIWLAGWMLCSN